MSPAFRRAALGAVLAFAVRPVAALDLPPLGPADWSATAPAADAQAPAIVLVQKAEIRLMDLARQEISSSLQVVGRVKVLDERGEDYGEILIPHSRFMRLVSFRGRTLLPDGTVVPLPADAKYVSKTSDRRKTFVTAVAFPQVSPGAILEYHYEMRWDSIFFLEPWYLSSDLPVRHAEVSYQVPESLNARLWAKDPFQVGLQHRTEPGVVGTRVSAWAENLPAIVVDTDGFPFADLATQFMVVPTAYGTRDALFRLLESWETTADLMETQVYRPFRKKDGAARRQAKELARGKGETEAAAIVYRWVRDEVHTEPVRGIGLAADATLDGVFERRRGDYMEKALLLEVMLDAAGVDAELVWAASRDLGRPDLSVPTPGWFDRALVAAEVDGSRVFLDAGESILPFGAIPAEVQGTEAVLPRMRKAETLVLPIAPARANARRAKVDLSLDGEGRLVGRGELVLSGQHAVEAVRRDPAPADLVKRWTDHLEEVFAGYDVGEVSAERDPDRGELRLAYTLAARDEEVLGDEATVVPARPLGPVRQRYTVPASARRSPVLRPFGDRDVVELTLSWPEGWTVETAPSEAVVEHPEGGYRVEVAVDEEARRLTYRRSLDLPDRELRDGAAYERLRRLFADVERADARIVALVRR